jgi:signal peptidase I
MEPNFENGDYLIIDELTYKLREPKRGEVIVFKYPLNPSQRFIKRIIGLPGETIEIKNNRITIFKDKKSQILDESSYLSPNIFTSGDIKVSLKENEYFVLGDDRIASYDSRNWGPLPRENIVGRVILRLWPLEDISKFKVPNYQ